MHGHYFLSYSQVDGREIAEWLVDQLAAGVPAHRLWLDSRQIAPGHADWDDQIDEAIRSCRGLLLVLTPDSVRAGSVCKDEWGWALRYKKPVVPLQLHPDAGLPFRLQARQYIDFTDGRDAGLARLRLFLADLDGPTGQLRELRFRIADAERALPRARDAAERARIEADLTDLRVQAAVQEQVTADPDAATRTAARIATGLELQRTPEGPPPRAVAPARFVNPPPMTVPASFQGRHAETALLAEHLAADDVRMVTVVGRGGVGKTTLVCRLLKGLETGRLPDGLTGSAVDGLVYLRTPGEHPVTFANLVTDLCRLLPPAAADRVLGRLRDPSGTPTAVVLALLDAFPDGRRVVLLDNVEDLLDEAGAFTDTALDEALRALLSAPAHGVTVVVTTRVAPRSLMRHHPGVQRRVDLDAGLPSPYAEQLLRARDPDGRLGLRAAPDAQLARARERTRGFPRALEALVAILFADRDTTLPELLDETAGLPDDVVQALVGEAFQRLDVAAQQVVQALAVFPEPVPAVAVDYLLQPYRPLVDAAPRLSRLVNMQFVRRQEGRRYDLHQVDRDYALGRIPLGSVGDRNANPPPFTRHALWHRAAEYFAEVQRPREEWRSIDDVAPKLAEFALRCRAGDHETAAEVLLDISYQLDNWGHYRLLVDLHRRIRGRVVDPWLRAVAASQVGEALQQLGDPTGAIALFEEALDIFVSLKDRPGEVNQMARLGFCHVRLGQVGRAIALCERALQLSRELGDPGSEAMSLASLAACYGTIGQLERAVELHEQGLAIDRSTGDRRGEATTLGNLGACYAELGRLGRAVDLFDQALAVDREVGYRYSEAYDLTELGSCHLALGAVERAVRCHRQAIDIADTIGSVQVMTMARRNLAVASLQAGDLETAHTAIVEARELPYPPQQARIALVDGVVRLRQSAPASAAFHDALARCDETLARTADDHDALYLRALALAGLTLGGPDDRTTDAVAAFRAARAVTAAPGVVADALRLLDALAPVDPDGKLATVRAAAAGE